MANKYKLYTPNLLDSTNSGELIDRNPIVDDVELAFSKIGAKGEYLGLWDGEQIPWPRYTANIDNKFGFQNHFQGIQRFQAGNYLVVSGADPHEPSSHLFVIKMGSRRANGGWRSNRIATGLPPDEDEIVRIIAIDAVMWHAGGLSISGDILVVPIYGGSPMNCRIVFYNMKDPENPALFNVAIERPGVKAGAVALTKLPNDYFLAAVWSDSDPEPLEKRFDFYLSRSTNFLNGFDQQPVTRLAKDVKAANGAAPKLEKLQNINFINRGDGKLFLIGTYNTSDMAPTIPGEDYAELFELDFAESLFKKQPTGRSDGHQSGEQPVF